MRLISFKHADDLQPRVGALDGDDVIDVARAYAARLSNDGVERAAAHANALLPGRMTDFLAEGEAALERTEEAVDFVREHDPVGTRFAREDVVELPVVPKPEKIFCLGQNYEAHAIEAGLEIPDYPVFFPKYPNCLVANGDPVVVPRVSDEFDYEVELAVIVGKRGRYIDEDDAFDHVAGYTVINDGSLRDYQFLSSQWMQGKTFDDSTPLGPCLVTADEIDDPHDLEVRTEVNGDVLQKAKTNDLIFPIEEIFAYASEFMTLEPGDVIATGTPAGVGFTREPPIFLEDGDQMETIIEDIGVLRNPVRSESGG